MLKFQRLFKDLSELPNRKLDIIANCLTIASACISFFLANFVEEDDKRFAIVPAGGFLLSILLENYWFSGYQKLDNQSEKARKFLKWYAEQLGVTIQTAESVDGEARIYDWRNGRTFRVDGYIPKALARTDADIVIEYLGCAYHGLSELKVKREKKFRS